MIGTKEKKKLEKRKEEEQDEKKRRKSMHLPIVVLLYVCIYMHIYTRMPSDRSRAVDGQL